MAFPRRLGGRRPEAWHSSSAGTALVGPPDRGAVPEDAHLAAFHCDASQSRIRMIRQLHSPSRGQTRDSAVEDVVTLQTGVHRPLAAWASGGSVLLRSWRHPCLATVTAPAIPRITRGKPSPRIR